MVGAAPLAGAEAVIAGDDADCITAGRGLVVGPGAVSGEAEDAVLVRTGLAAAGAGASAGDAEGAETVGRGLAVGGGASGTGASNCTIVPSQALGMVSEMRRH